LAGLGVVFLLAFSVVEFRAECECSAGAGMLAALAGLVAVGLVELAGCLPAE
jgi:hypothetical protein